MIGKKEFTAFAIALRDTKAKEETITAIKRILQSLNPRFDTERFDKAVYEGRFRNTKKEYLKELIRRPENE